MIRICFAKNKKIIYYIAAPFADVFASWSRRFRNVSAARKLVCYQFIISSGSYTEDLGTSLRVNFLVVFSLSFSRSDKEKIPNKILSAGSFLSGVLAFFIANVCNFYWLLSGSSLVSHCTYIR